MRTLNRIVIIGRVGRDPELRVASSGGSVWCTLSVATNRPRRDGDQWIEETDWHHVRVFGREAEYVNKHIRKGALVAVDGGVTYDKWTGPDGAKHSHTRILADRVSLLNAAPVRAESTAETADSTTDSGESAEEPVALA